MEQSNENIENKMIKHETECVPYFVIPFTVISAYYYILENVYL